MLLSPADSAAIVLSIKLAVTVTSILLLIAIPCAWWLVRTSSWLKGPVSALIALPLVLPPSVLGFYFLLALSPTGWVGATLASMGLQALPFTFEGLVVASLFYSLPFVVQPIRHAMDAIGSRPLEVAATRGAGCLDRFITVVLPLSRTGIISAGIFGFAHTLGEFGVVLMIGGSIPGETQVISVLLYEHVETLAYGRAHTLALLMLASSFVIMLSLYYVSAKQKRYKKALSVV